MPQPRYNPKTRKDDYYYRIKESFRDLTGRVRSRVMLNVGFIEEEHRAEDIRDIGKCLTWLSSHKGNITTDLFGNPLGEYNEFVQRKTLEFWEQMLANGSIDAVKETIEQSREKAGRLVDVNTVKDTCPGQQEGEGACMLRCWRGNRAEPPQSPGKRIQLSLREPKTADRL